MLPHGELDQTKHRLELRHATIIILGITCIVTVSLIFISPICPIIWVSMTSSAKPEAHNVLYCRQKRTEPWLRITYIENFVKFGPVFNFDRREQTDKQKDTDKQTYRHAHCRTSLPYRGRTNYHLVTAEPLFIHKTIDIDLGRKNNIHL